MKALLLGLLLCASLGHAEPKRWALALGENRGLGDDPSLRYAQTDAQHVLQVLQDLGGVDPGRAVLIAGGDANATRKRLTALEQRLMNEATSDDLLVLYVSAHADEGALHLDGTRLPMAELLAFMKRAPVGVAILIVDSCRSGALTRLKGLKVTETPARQVDLVAGALEGRVVITSSGADEYAQESDLVEGSYFTHHLLGGLRGPADASGDGRVTLEEAYAWAFSRTVESTFATRGGVQRPEVRVDLRGYGALVLTEPGKSGSRLVLDAKEPGEWLIASLDPQGGVSLVQKGEGPAAVALPAGRYSVRLRTDDGYREKQVTLASAATVAVRGDEMATGNLVRVALKGREPDARLTASVGGVMSSGMLAGLPFGVGAEVRLGAPKLIPGQLGLALGFRSSAGASFSQYEIEARLAWMPRWTPWRFAIGVGPEAGGVLVLQRDLPDGSSRTGLEGYAGLAFDVRLKLKGPLWLELGGSAGALAVKKVRGTSAVFRAQGFAGLAFDVL